jgi:hypothetical protein
MPARPLTCATCGKDPRESAEPRRSGANWYCSAYCALHDEVSKSRPRATPAPAARRRVRFALVFVVALVAATVAAVFIESSGSSPVAFGQAQTFGAWKVAVASVDWSAGSAPPGARSIIVTVTVRYLGAGAARPPLAFLTEGARHAPYGDPELAGSPDLLPDTMYSGSQERFPLDFTVAANDLNTLRLYVYYRTSTMPVQYALRIS